MTFNSSQISLRSYDADSCSHSHDFAQLVLPIRGIMELQAGCRSGLVGANTGAFIAPNEIHCFSASQGNLFLVADIKRQDLALNLNSIPSFLTLTATTKHFLHFAQSYLMQKDNDFFSDYLVQNLLLKLLAQPLLSERDRAVLLAKHWIDEHFATPVNINKLTQICHLSASQLQRRFKRETGQTLAEYWRTKKLQHAQILLSTERLTIETIAYQVGYENLSAFSRRFTQSFGLSPSQWRDMTLAAKRMREEDNRLKLDC